MRIEICSLISTIKKHEYLSTFLRHICPFEDFLSYNSEYS